jgi:hypothetical protein
MVGAMAMVHVLEGRHGEGGHQRETALNGDGTAH